MENVNAQQCVFLSLSEFERRHYEFSSWIVRPPQRSNAVRVRNMSRFNGGRKFKTVKTLSKSQKIKQFLEWQALNVEFLWKNAVCLLLTLSPRTLLCHCISSKAFLRTSLRKRFELKQKDFQGTDNRMWRRFLRLTAVKIRPHYTLYELHWLRFIAKWTFLLALPSCLRRVPFREQYHASCTD